MKSGESGESLKMISKIWKNNNEFEMKVSLKLVGEPLSGSATKAEMVIKMHRVYLLDILTLTFYLVLTV